MSYVARRVNYLPPIRYLPDPSGITKSHKRLEPETGRHLLDQLFERGLIFYFNSNI